LSAVRIASIIGQHEDNPAKSNAAGKSTLGDLIMYALFETVPTDLNSVSDMVSWGEDKMRVELEFEYEGNQFLVVREHSPNSRSKNLMELSINGSMVGKDLSERRKVLADYLGITDQVAQATWFFQQSESNKLTSADPRDRKDYLSAVLDSAKYEKAYEHSKQKLQDLEYRVGNCRTAGSDYERLSKEVAEATEKCAENERSMNVLAARLADEQAYLKRLNESIDASNRQRARLPEINDRALKREQEMIRNIQMEGDASLALEDHRNTVATAHQRRSELVTQLQTCEAETALIRQRWLDAGYTEKFYVDVQKHVWGLMTQSGSLTQQKKKLSDQLASVSILAGPCPSCGQIVTVECKDQLMADIDKDINETNNQFSLVSEKLKSMQHNESLANTDSKRLSDLEILVDSSNREISKIDGSLSGSAATETMITQQLQTLNSAIQSARLDIETLNAERGAILGDDDDARVQEAAELQARVSATSTSLQETTINAGRWQEYFASMKAQMNSLRDRSKDLAQLESEYRLQKMVTALFHRDGLPLAKVSAACSLIEAYANIMMSSVLPHYHVKVVVESGVRGKLDFMVMTPSGMKPYGVLSGGEKSIAGLCLRMALSRILAEGSGRRFQTLFLDEVFAQLDQVYRPIMMSLVKDLSKSFAAIYVISHEPEIQMAFPQIVLVTKNKSGSTVQLLDNNEVKI
jgi:DNA repair exonuclease SbcCD ATPase subunit